jgi:hypothetical protein
MRHLSLFKKVQQPVAFSQQQFVMIYGHERFIVLVADHFFVVSTNAIIVRGTGK